MILVVDFDRTFLKNDFFSEALVRQLLQTPLGTYRLFQQNKNNWVGFKEAILSKSSIPTDISNLIDPFVAEWINRNRHRFSKIVLVSASPDSFVKKLISPLGIFDEVHGSTTINLKGTAKRNFIQENWGAPFAYIGDSRSDIPIFQAATEAIKVQTLRSASATLKPTLSLIRTHNWIKNLLIFLPFLLAHRFSLSQFISLILAFFSLSLMASACYIINDILDIQNDRLHKEKKYRPLAAAELSITQALLFSGLLFCTCITLTTFLSIHFIPWILLYGLGSIMYSIYLKQVRFIDILTLTGFYMFRVFWGGEVSDTELTGWFVSTMAMAIFALAFSKRYLELLFSDKTALPGRAYTKEDMPMLQLLMYNFAVGSILLLNVHAYFVLMIRSPYFFLFLNVLAIAILLFYFDARNKKADDPVQRVTRSIPLIIFVLLFLGLYFFEMIQH
ncbi:MAG: UbiA family prenyltransferase [Chitinophagaceae bacterium]|nr:UbiA family prenyltransferase [Chitinophagaceae bacterium]